MRRYWYRIDYNNIKDQKPHKPFEIYEGTQEKTSFFDYDFTGYSEAVVKMLLKQREKARARSLFLESNYIKRKKGERRSYQNRDFDFNKAFHIIYYICFLYYKMDAFLYYYQLLFGYFGDKEFRKFVRKIVTKKPVIMFRFLFSNFVYLFFILPVKSFFKGFYFFFIYLLYKNIFCRIMNFINFFFKSTFFIRDKVASYYHNYLNTRKKSIIKMYYNMYSHPYRQYFQGWRRFRTSFRQNKLYFSLEMKELYFYFKQFTLTTWIVEAYYIFYNFIFFFYPFIIPCICLLPFILFGYFLFFFYIKSLYITIFIVIFLFLVIAFVIFLLIYIEITKYYLANLALEPINWYTLDFVSKIAAFYNTFRLFFRKKHVRPLTQIRRNIRFFYYHELTMIQPKISSENIQFIRQDKRRGSSFFKRLRIYPHLPPRFWCQYGKCFYFNLVLGFHFVENLFAGISKLNSFERNVLGLFRMPLAMIRDRLTMFDFFWFFYNFLFLVLYFWIFNLFSSLNFFFFKIDFTKYYKRNLYYIFQRFFFLSLTLLLVFYLIPCCIKAWINLFYVTSVYTFFLFVLKRILFQPFYFFLGLTFLSIILAWFTYNKHFNIMMHTFTFHIFIIKRINFILFLFLIIISLYFVCFSIVYGYSFYFASDVLLEHPYCLSYFKDVVYNLI